MLFDQLLDVSMERARERIEGYTTETYIKEEVPERE